VICPYTKLALTYHDYQDNNIKIIKKANRNELQLCSSILSFWILQERYEM